MNIAFHTLGCKLNFSETSFIANDIKQLGYHEVQFDEIADIYVINTCTVTENANKECQYLIRKVLKKNPVAKTVIIGCYAQLKPKEIAQINGVNLVLGNNEKFKLGTYLKDLYTTKETTIITKDSSELNEFKTSFSFGDRTRTFLKIQDGCDYKCSFCTIPLARGESRSDSVQNIIDKIEKLKKKGVKEIVLTGINIGDFKNKKGEKLIDLLKHIDTLDNIRIRLSSIEPNLITRDIIEVFSKSNVLVPHFHIPLQSGSDKILHLMRRRYISKNYKQTIQLIHDKIKNACIGVDVIVGFPGENDFYFNETLLFLKSLNISYLHVFSYSERENTDAIKLAHPVKIEDKKYRSKVLRNLSEKKKRAFYEGNIGLIKEVLFENKNINGFIYGFSENYIKVKSKYQDNLLNQVHQVKINTIDTDHMTCVTGNLI